MERRAETAERGKKRPRCDERRTETAEREKKTPSLFGGGAVYYAFSDDGGGGERKRAERGKSRPVADERRTETAEREKKTPSLFGGERQKSAALPRRFLPLRQMRSKEVPFNYPLRFFFLITAAADTAAQPLMSSRAIHRARLLVSPVGGFGSPGSFSVTVDSREISSAASASA